MTHSTTDYLGAWSNFLNSGRQGYLNVNGESLKGRILSMYPEVRVTIDGKPGAIILTFKQFRCLWRDDTND